MDHYYRSLPAQAGLGQSGRAVGNNAHLVHYGYRVGLLVFTLWLSVLCAQAQAPSLQWQKALGGTSTDEAFAITAMGDGGLVVAGYTSSTAGDVTGNRGGGDVWVVKLDAQGSLLWQKTLGGTSGEIANAVTATSDGGLVVAGYTESNDGDVTGNQGQTDVWVVKLDAQGNLLWQKTLGGSGRDYANAITALSDGGLVVAGYTNSTDGNVTGNQGGNDVWVVKLDAQGNLQWQKALGGSGDDRANTITATSDGGLVVAGYTNSTNGDVTGNHGGIDIWVVKLDAQGNPLWRKALGGSNSERANAITVTSDGGVVVAGFSSSTNGDVTGTRGGSDVWVVKLDAQGNLQWQKTLGGMSTDDAYGLTATGDGGVVVTGITVSTDGDITGNQGGYDYWVVKLDAQGNLLWQKTLGGTGYDESRAVTVTSDGGLVVAGYTESNDGDVTGNQGRSDYWVAKLLAAPPCGSIVYVTPDGAGLQDGSSWANAFAGTALQTAINTAAGCGAQVWVAQGTYKPTTGEDRTISFAMQNGVAIYGGFLGSEATLTDRNPASYTTVLSGDIGEAGTSADNSYHVINNPPGLTQVAVLDGFVITAGNANGPGTATFGGGMYNDNSSPVVANCSFVNNQALSGGGMYNQRSSPVLINCLMTNNTANTGGGMGNNVSSPTLTNCVFLTNSALANGGAMNNRFGSNPALTNCSLLYNVNGGGIWSQLSSPSLTNCVLFGNGGNTFFNLESSPILQYCLLEPAVTGYTNGSGNLTTTTSPFVSATDLRLKPCSPAINAGDNAAYTTANGPAIDLAGNPRLFNGGVIDMGAYEYQGDPVTVTVSNPAVSTATVGQVFSQAFSASGGTEPYSFSVVSSDLPASLSLSSAGVVSGTPTQVGSYTLLVQASDANGCVGVASTAFSLTVGAAAPPCGSIVYVTPDGAGLLDGSSWANAFGGTALQTAINTAAGCGAQVWVAQGTYKPTTGEDRSVSFFIPPGLQVYGGFVGTGSDPDTRTVFPSSTTLSGDIGTVGDNADNTYHVVTFRNAGSQTRLDNFMITAGNSNNYGGGIYNDGSGEGGNSSPTLVNLNIIANAATEGGAGMYNNGVYGNCSPVLTNVNFTGNSTPYQGGAMQTVGNFSPVLTNVSFVSNSAESGGAMYNNMFQGSSRFVLTNVSFLNNFAFVGGGAMYNIRGNESNPLDCQYELTNVSFLGNSAAGGGGTIVNGGVSFTLHNGVIYGNEGATTLLIYGDPIIARYSLFEAGITGYSSDPTNLTTTTSPFVSATDPRLKPCSPAINAGDNTAYTTANGPATDLAGSPRLFNSGVIDMGAYEYQGDPVTLTVSNPAVSTATVGQAFSQAFTATGGTEPYSFSVVSSNLPASLSLSNAGVLSGTPTEVGSYTLLVQAGDANGCLGVASTPYTVTVSEPVPDGPVCDTYTNRTTANGLGSNAVLGVYAVGSAVYAATGTGLSISADGGQRFTNKTTANGLVINAVNGVYAVGNVVYAATRGGLSISTDGGNSFINKTTANGLGNNFVYNVYVVGNVVYAATANGLGISTDGGISFTNKTVDENLSTNVLRSVYVVGSVVYAATNGGGLNISTDGGSTFINKNTLNSGLGGNTVRSVYAVGSTVYAATEGGLSISTDEGNSFTNRTTANGLGDNNVLSVYVVGSVVYVATNGGLSISTDGGTSFTNRTTANGLGGNSVLGVFTLGNRTYAATFGGLSFCPALPAPLVLSSFTASPTTLLTTESTSLSAVVTGGTPGAPDRSYNYVFSGPGVITPSGNTAIVSGLSAGEQTFTVTVSDATAPANQTVTGTVSVTVSEVNTPPTIANAIPPQSVTVDQAVSFDIPAATFTDTETPTSLVLSVAGLPAGLSFTAPATISGTPSTTVDSPFSVTVTATDPGNLAVSTVFAITVQPAPVAVTPLVLSSFTASPTMLLTTGSTSLSASVTGGTGPYSYVFSGPGVITPSGNTASVSGLSAGVQTFTVVATDATTPVSQTVMGVVGVTVSEPVPDGPTCDTYTNKTTANGLGNNTVRGVYVVGSVIYAATNGGVSISTDGGSSFTTRTTANGLGSNTVFGVYAVGSTIYAATQGGLSISTDGGSSFINKTAANGLGNNFVGGVYAEGSVVYAATAGGLSISTDGGSSFTNRTTANGLGNNFVGGVYALGSVVYAATAGGLALSTDGGGSFTNRTTANGLGNNFVSRVYAEGNVVYAATNSGLSISTDGGGSFTSKTTANGLGGNTVYGVYALGSVVYAATNSGLSISTDGGSNFTNKTTVNGLGNNNAFGVYALGSAVYTATANGLSLCTVLPEPLVLSSFTASPATLLATESTSLSAVVTGGTSGAPDRPYSYVFSGPGVITPSGNTASVSGLSAGVQTFTVVATDATTPVSQTVTGTVSVTVSEPVPDGPTCDTYTTRTTANGLGNNIVLGVYAVGNVVYAATGGGGLSISADGGSTFTTTASGLGNNVVLGVYAEGRVVYAATNGGLSISTDGGTSFINKTTANGLGNNAVRGVYAEGNMVYAATFGGGLSISTDGGSSFTTRTTANGLGNNIVNGVYAVGSVVYAATQSGLGISTDGGTSFTNSGLGTTIVYGVYVVGNVVYAATNGGLSISTDGGSSFTTRTTANGLGSNIVSGVYALGNTVYAATNGGLSISTDGGSTFINKTRANGLVSNDVRGVYALGSRVYAATFGGGLSFCPAPPAPLALSSFTASPTMLLTTASTSLSATVTGGTGPYSYVFSGPGVITPSGNTATVAGLSAGVQTFTLTATDATSPTSQTVTGTVSVTVSEANTPPTVANAIPPQSATVGQGFSFDIPANTFTDTETPASLTLTVAGLPTGLSFTAPATISGTPSTTVDSPFSVTVTATDPGNLAVNTVFTVTVQPAPVVVTPLVLSSFTASPTMLLTTGSTSLSAVVAGGTPGAPDRSYSYVFSGPGVITPSGNTAIVSGLSAGVQTFTVVVSDATAPTNQTVTGTVSVTVSEANTPPTVANAIPPQSATVGQGFSFDIPANTFTDTETPASLTLTVAGLPTGLSFTAPATISGTPSTTVGSPFSVTVTATDPGNLAVSTVFTIIVQPAPVVVTPLVLSSFTASPTMLLTTGSTSLSAVVAGGTPGAPDRSYSYVFSGPGVITPSGNTAIVSGLSAGVQTFSLTVTDATAPTNQTVTGTVSVTVSSNTPVISEFRATPDVVCAGSLLRFTATLANLTGSYNFTLTNGSSMTVGSSTGSAFSQSLIAMSTGYQNFTLTVGADNFQVTATTSVTVSALPTAGLTNNGPLSCNLTSVTLTASGGNSYTFTSPEGGVLGTSGATTTRVVSNPGSYSVRVSNVNGCLAVASTSVSQDNTAPVASLVSSGSLTCSVTSVTMTAGPIGQSYTFSGPGIVSQSGNTAVVNASGMYSVTVVSANGCSSVASVVVSQDNTTPTASLVSSGNLSCAVMSVTLTASPNGLSYRFSRGAMQIGTTSQAVVNASGTYSVTVVNDNGCSSVASVNVSKDNSPPGVSITASPSETISQGQSATLTATSSTPLTRYAWSTLETTPAIAVSTSGPYSVTVTAANGCSATASVVVSVTAAPVESGPFAITGVTTVDCTPVLPNRYSISFTPRYAGLNGQPITFSVANELLPTPAPGPYTLQLYTDNPVLTLRATQGGSPPVQTSFVYNWLEACRASVSGNTPPRVAMMLPPQSATVGVGFSYVIPAGTFTDDQTPGSLVLSAGGVPAGLSLSGYTISGVPASTVGSPYSVTITATDPGGLSVSTSLVLTVSPGPATPPVPTGVFSITGVSLLRCTPVADRINISFAPQYGGLNGQPIAFRVVNELAPTNDPAPYSLTLYRDNPVIRLRATQTGSVGEASFDYNWLVGCASLGADNTVPRVVNPVGSQTATVGVGYRVNLSNVFADQETPNAITLSVAGLPTGLSLVGTAISGTPSVSGTSTVTLTATDPGNLSTSTSFVLVVSPAVSQTVSPPAGFAITGVETVSCVAVSADLRRVSFTPQYTGLNGQPITFSVVNELAATNTPGPYVLNLYTDNPVINLRVSQGGSGSEVSYSYNWLAACGAGSRISAEPAESLRVAVLGNPVVGETVEVEVQGAAGVSLRLETLSERGHSLDRQGVAQAGRADRFTLRLGSSAGVYLLQVSTPTQSQTLKILKR